MVRSGPDLRSGLRGHTFDLTHANFSTEPYFVYRYITINTEGPYQLFAHSDWASCDESGDQVRFIGNTTNYTNNFGVDFAIKAGRKSISSLPRLTTRYVPAKSDLPST